MLQLNDPKAQLAKAVADNERDLMAALESVPAEYRGYITILEQSKKVAGSKQSPVYAPIKTAYMAVDGRVKMFTDAHASDGSRFTITTELYFGDYPHCRAIVSSDKHGGATGTAKIGFGGGGADSTNPIENAETSAVGRALGFLGYGLLGGGIASAEEVLNAIKEREG